jgi:hypothetical protein
MGSRGIHAIIPLLRYERLTLVLLWALIGLVQGKSYSYYIGGDVVCMFAVIKPRGLNCGNVLA